MILSLLFGLSLSDTFPPPYYEVQDLTSLKIFRSSDNKLVYEYVSETEFLGFAYRTKGWWSRSGTAFAIPHTEGILFWNPRAGAKVIKLLNDERYVDYYLDNLAFSLDGDYLLYRTGISGATFVNVGNLYCASHHTGAVIFIAESVRNARFEGSRVKYQTVEFVEPSSPNESSERVADPVIWRMKSGF